MYTPDWSVVTVVAVVESEVKAVRDGEEEEGVCDDAAEYAEVAAAFATRACAEAVELKEVEGSAWVEEGEDGAGPPVDTFDAAVEEDKAKIGSSLNIDSEEDELAPAGIADSVSAVLAAEVEARAERVAAELSLAAARDEEASLVLLS